MIAARLKQARLVAGLTQDQVVQSLGELGKPMTKAALSKYELGKSVPKPTLLIMLAQVLAVKTDYFLSEPSVSVKWSGFRKKTGLTKGAETRIKARAANHVEHWVCLRDTLCPTEKPSFSVPRSIVMSRDAEIAANTLRRNWGLGDAPIKSTVQAIEDHGGIVFGSDELDEKFDGLSGMVNRNTPLIVTTTKAPKDRFRFNVAHELGHVVLGLGDSKEDNQLAHRFAAAFLVPCESALRELGHKRSHIGFGELSLLKMKYGMSMSAWLHRAMELDIISAAHYQRYMRLFSKRGWRKREPNPLAGFPEKSTRLKQMVLHALSEGIISEGKAEEMIPGISQKVETMKEIEPKGHLSPVELMKLPRAGREEILSRAAEAVEEEYRTDPELTDFEAFAEEDL